MCVGVFEDESERKGECVSVSAHECLGVQARVFECELCQYMYEYFPLNSSIICCTFFFHFNYLL